MAAATKPPEFGHDSAGVQIELSDGEIFEVSDREARTLYETLLERARQHGATSAAGKLRPALTWSSGSATKVSLNRIETAAVMAVREHEELS